MNIEEMRIALEALEADPNCDRLTNADWAFDTLRGGLLKAEKEMQEMTPVAVYLPEGSYNLEKLERIVESLQKVIKDIGHD